MNFDFISIMAEEAIEVTDGIEQFMYDENNIERRSWKFCNFTLPRSEVIFFTQVFIVLIIILTSIVKISLYEITCEEMQIWIALMSSAVGYVLPSPKL